jgi:hypothetical protein
MRDMAVFTLALGVLGVMATSVAATPPEPQSDSQSSDPNAANNPLTPKVTFQFNNYYEPSFVGPAEEGNLFQLRGIVPQKLFGQDELLRATLPLVTSPAVQGVRNARTGSGDIELDEIVKFKVGKAQLGLGPLLILPTASDQRLGEGKWQTGVAGLAIVPQKWGLAGLIFTYSTSFAGERGRLNQENVIVQPLLIYNVAHGYYYRSSAVWQFDLKRNPDFIPIGLGFGKLLKPNPKTVVNLSVEPQYTVWSQGINIPRWQILFSATVQLGE